MHSKIPPLSVRFSRNKLLKWLSDYWNEAYESGQETAEYNERKKTPKVVQTVIPGCTISIFGLSDNLREEVEDLLFKVWNDKIRALQVEGTLDKSISWRGD